MAPVELSRLRRLCSEVEEVGKIDADAGKVAHGLLRDFLDACSRYNAAVASTTFGLRAPEGDYPGERDAWRKEVEKADERRRNAHNVMIDSYRILLRFCRRYRDKDMTIEVKFNANAERAELGDLAQLIRRGLDQARDLDVVLFERLNK